MPKEYTCKVRFVWPLPLLPIWCHKVSLWCCRVPIFKKKSPVPPPSPPCSHRFFKPYPPFQPPQAASLKYFHSRWWLTVRSSAAPSISAFLLIVEFNIIVIWVFRSHPSTLIVVYKPLPTHTNTPHIRRIHHRYRCCHYLIVVFCFNVLIMLMFKEKWWWRNIIDRVLVKKTIKTMS